MIDLTSITIKNFLSIGNVTQGISFSNQQLVLVLGDNLDLGGNDSRNGAGKSAIVNAIFYAFFGDPLTKIKKDNLINKINGKQMLVTVEFQKGQSIYRIERGRKPNICKLFANGDMMSGDDENESQGESRLTQTKINELLGMSKEMMRQILLLNTHNDSFLELNTAGQTAVIEQLFGITKLSEKAEILRIDVRNTKDQIKEEEFRIKATIAANTRIEQNIKSTEMKSSGWESTRKATISVYRRDLETLRQVNIDKELEAHGWNTDRAAFVNAQTVLVDEATRLMKTLTPLEAKEKRLEKKIENAQEIGICPMCEQPMDGHTHDKVIQGLETDLLEITAEISDKKNSLVGVETGLTDLTVPLKRKTFYKHLQLVYEHKGKIEILESKLLAEEESENPYIEQVETLREHGLQTIDRTELEELISQRDHQEFLYKLLSSRDSFIRKRIIEQNIAMLNARLLHYIGEMGLQHGVKFLSDLNIEITLLGNTYDFDNLSRGEKTRLVLCLSFAFRDVWEAQNGRISLLWIDELLDAGLDASGVDGAMVVLKKMARDGKRNIFLISHREELIGRVNTILTVTKENGFSTFSETTN